MSARQAVLFGKELVHSISNVLHTELASVLARTYPEAEGLRYDLVECTSSEEFNIRLKQLAKDPLAIGANVTYPYKNDLFQFSGRHVGVASAIKSGNAARFSNGMIECASTDGIGFLLALQRQFPAFDLEPYHLIVIGDGAAAKAVTYSLCTTWMPLSLTIVSRSRQSAESLASFYLAGAPGPTIRVFNINDVVHLFPEKKYRMVVQATPLGQKGHPGNLLAGFEWDPTDLAVDLIYNPVQTTFLAQAAGSGAKTMNGLGMLIEQAALSQVFWYSGLLPSSSPISEDIYKQTLQYLTTRLS